MYIHVHNCTNLSTWREKIGKHTWWVDPLDQVSPSCFALHTTHQYGTWGLLEALPELDAIVEVMCNLIYSNIKLVNTISTSRTDTDVSPNSGNYRLLRYFFSALRGSSSTRWSRIESGCISTKGALEIPDASTYMSLSTCTTKWL